MSQGYQIKDQSSAYFLTLQVIDWVDLFTGQKYCNILLKNLKYCQINKGLEIYAYVIMSNHIHMLVRATNNNLSDVIRDFKSYTSKKIIKTIIEENDSRGYWMLQIFRNAAKRNTRNQRYQVWTHENHAEEIFSNKFTEQKVRYIHENPVKAGIVRRAEDYKYSSAGFYADLENELEVTKIVFSIKTY